MRGYAMQKYARRLAHYIAKLGGCCVRCRSKDDLQFDHIDKATKAFAITSRLWWASEAILDAETAKCQLLCKPCHADKTLEDRGQLRAKGTHGTLSSYRYCKCELCREAKSAHGRAYNLKRKHAAVAKRSTAPAL